MYIVNQWQSIRPINDIWKRISNSLVLNLGRVIFFSRRISMDPSLLVRLLHCVRQRDRIVIRCSRRWWGNDSWNRRWSEESSSIIFHHQMSCFKKYIPNKKNLWRSNQTINKHSKSLHYWPKNSLIIFQKSSNLKV